MVIKSGKVLCRMFLLAVMEVDFAQKKDKMQKVAMCGNAHSTKRWKHCDSVIHA